MKSRIKLRVEGRVSLPGVMAETSAINLGKNQVKPKPTSQ